MAYNEDLIRELGKKFTNHSDIARKYVEAEGGKFGNVRKKVSNLLNKEKSSITSATSIVNESVTDTNDYKNDNLKLSARPGGRVLNIEEYCKYYNFPLNEVTSYKLITHSGEPVYNIVFKPVTLIKEFDFKESLREVLYEYDKPKKYKKVSIPNVQNFNRIIYTDSHIGMDTGGKNALYPTLWNKETQDATFNRIADEAIKHKTSEILYLDDLGDHMDGLDAMTTRKGHKLPQNMSNKEAFKQGINCKMILADRLHNHFKKIVFNNICNDNHAGDFGYFCNETFKGIVELKYNNIEVVNHESFISHYGVGRHAKIISHGKDEEFMKFGFKVHIDDKQIGKIDAYCKEHRLYRDYDFIEFSKGDSHQCLLDMCSSDDFFYFNYMALSPSSEWVQTNFKRGRRGFMIQDINLYDNNGTSTPIWL